MANLCNYRWCYRFVANLWIVGTWIAKLWLFQERTAACNNKSVTPPNYPSEIDNGWANVWGRTLGFPLRSPERRGESCIRPYMLDSPLCPKVVAPPRYFVYFPLGFANGSSFKGALLMQGHASKV